jgi:hypothetical protein
MIWGPVNSRPVGLRGLSSILGVPVVQDPSVPPNMIYVISSDVVHEPFDPGLWDPGA